MKRLRTVLSKEAFIVVHDSNFRYFLSYRFFLTSAILMQSVIVGWQLYDITKNVFSLGLIGLTEVIPQVSIALFAGHFVDLYDRRKIILYTTHLLLLGSGILFLYSIPRFDLIKLLGTIPIYVTVFITGFVRGIVTPANNAFLGQIIPRARLAHASSWNSNIWHFAAVLGPAIGGMIYGYSGVVAAYGTVFMFNLTGILLARHTKSVNRPPKSETKQPMFQRINEGIKYVYKNQVLFGAFSLDMFAVLFGGAVALLPAFASDILRVGPQGLGLLRACPAFGAIIMSTILTFYPPVNRSGKLLLFSVAGFGICMIGFALSKNFYISLALLIVSGLFDNVSVVVRGTILQLFTPDDMRGRVAAVNSIFVGSSNELGAFESGLTARFMGLVASVLFGGIMTLLVTLVAARYAPKLRNLDLKKELVT